MADMNLLRALYRNSMSGSGSSWGQGGASDHARSMQYSRLLEQGFTPTQISQIMSYGGASGQWGANPNDQQLMQWAQATAQNNPMVAQALNAGPASGQRRRNVGTPAPAMAGATNDFSTGNPLLDRLLSDAEQERQNAFASNDQRSANINAINRSRAGRADETLRELRDRVLGRIDNWKDVEQRLNAEKSEENVGNILSGLHARGLGMSDRDVPIRLRAQRDLELVNDAVSNQADARYTQADTALTNQWLQNLNDIELQRAQFAERETDEGPDLGMITQLALQAGAANDGRGYFDDPSFMARYPYAAGYGQPRFNTGPAFVPFGGGGGQPQPQYQPTEEEQLAMQQQAMEQQAAAQAEWERRRNNALDRKAKKKAAQGQRVRARQEQRVLGAINSPLAQGVRGLGSSMVPRGGAPIASQGYSPSRYFGPNRAVGNAWAFGGFPFGG